MDDVISPLSLTDTFAFSCSARVACFNDCCRDLNQFLMPYDILRLKIRNFLDNAENRKTNGIESDAIPPGDDETDLLRFGFRWVKQRLFKEVTCA